MRLESDTHWREVARVAARQHGIVTLEQLEGLGISQRAVSRRAAAGYLHRLHRGVYAVGHRGITVEGRWLGAVFACGDGAALSHRSAAGLWGLLRPVAAPVHVTAPTTAGVRQQLGIRVHRSRTLTATEVVFRNRIPVTSLHRTLADLRRAGDGAELHRATRQAEVLGLVADPAGEERTNGELERRFLLLCRRHGLPEPEVNVRVAGHLVDFHWREDRLVVETDGYRYHRGATAFEDDHGRDLDLRAAGYAVSRFTYRQVVDEPGRVVRAVAADLSRR
jgi:very-short-patch-repair endonuclease